MEDSPLVVNLPVDERETQAAATKEVEKSVTSQRLWRPAKAMP